MSYLDDTVRDLLDAVAARTTAPGGGVTAALVAGMAAGLTEMAASFAADDATAGQARDLRDRATGCADDDAQAYGDVRAASGPDERRRALQRATDVPLQVVEVARETALLAAPFTRGGRPALRGDAAVAVVLADAAARAATHLVRCNVDAGDLDPSLVGRAERWCGDTAALAAQATAERGTVEGAATSPETDT